MAAIGRTRNDVCVSPNCVEIVVALKRVKTVVIVVEFPRKTEITEVIKFWIVKISWSN